MTTTATTPEAAAGAPPATARRILVLTGNGKGKTTSALGMILRASGHGLRVEMIQFLKSNADVGELRALRHLPGVTVRQHGRGFVPAASSATYEAHRAKAHEALDLARHALENPANDMVVLDEVCGAIAKGLIDELDLIDAVRASACRIVILTGRLATRRLMDLADTVSEIVSVKHGYEQGIRAQKGVED